MSFEKQHLRHCLLFAFTLKKNAAEAQEMICAALGEDAIAYSTCKKWFQRFRNGNFDLHDEERPGQPKKVEDEELEQLLAEDSCRTQSELAEELGVTRQAIFKRLYKLGRIQKEGRWVPHALTAENKSRRCDVAISLLSKFKRKDFLHKIVICDEKWILYDNPKEKKLRVYPGEPSTSTARPKIHAKKLLLCIWWDQRGVIHYELLRPGEMVTAEHYKQQLIRVSDALEEKRPHNNKGRRKVILLQDNARPQTAKQTLKTITDLGWEIILHPAYSPDFVPSDYHLFRSLQHHLARRHFTSFEDVDRSITKFIHSKSPSFFRSGILQLPGRWRKCIESEGDYFEDWVII